MDLMRAMRTFVEIAERGSLTAAARAQGTSLPATVRTLAALETHLGVRLFNRTTRRIALTDEGRNYLESSRGVLAAVSDAENALKEESAELAGPITVTAPMQCGQLVVAPVVTLFALRHPKVHVRMLLNDRVLNLVENRVDIAVRIGELEDSSVVAQPLGSIRRVVVASPALLAKVGKPKHPEDLRNLPCVRVTGEGRATWSFPVGKRRTLQVPVRGNLEFDQIAPAVDACVAGAGFGLFLSYQVRSPIAAGTLKMVLTDFEPPPKPVNVVYPHARLLPSRTRLLIEGIKREFGSNAAFNAPRR